MMMMKKAVSLVVMLAFLAAQTTMATRGHMNEVEGMNGMNTNDPETAMAAVREAAREQLLLSNIMLQSFQKPLTCVGVWQPCGPLYPCCKNCQCKFIWTGPYFTCEPPRGQSDC